MLNDKAGDEDAVVSELKSTVATRIAKYAVPDEIMVSGLTASGWTALFIYIFFSSSHN